MRDRSPSSCSRRRRNGALASSGRGLAGGLTKTITETAREAEMTEIGAIELEVPRDRSGSFESKIVRKRQRRLGGIDEIMLSLTARGLTMGEVIGEMTA